MEEKEEFFAIARKRIGLSPFTEEDIARNTKEGETYWNLLSFKHRENANAFRFWF